ncbi:hypothetical protein KGQ29_00885 [Patescibacteria group bacterium]|nr:hypothetical protein [Patescibacteria group bacterium]MDE1988268.1 hypothetical protein [Patescibacteria group bacterium]
MKYRVVKYNFFLESTYLFLTILFEKGVDMRANKKIEQNKKKGDSEKKEENPTPKEKRKTERKIDLIGPPFFYE